MSSDFTNPTEIDKMLESFTNTIDYFRALYVVVFIIVCVSVAIYFFIDDDTFQKMMIFQAIIAVSLGCIVAFIESKVNEMKDAEKDKKKD